MGIMEMFALSHVCIGIAVGVISAIITALIIKDREKKNESEPKESPTGLRKDPTGNGR